MVNKKWWVLIFIVIGFIGTGLWVYFYKDLPEERNCGTQEAEQLQKEIDDISAQGGGIVEVAPCVYELTDALQLKTGIHLKGAGQDKTIFRIAQKNEEGVMNTNPAFTTAEGSKNVTLSDLSVDGNKEKRRKIIDSHAHTVVLAKVDGFAIDNVKIINSTGASLLLYNSKNGVVKNSHIVDSGSNGILGLQEVNNVQVKDNVVENTDNQNGIFFSYQEGKSVFDITVERNTVKNAADFGIEIGHIVEEGHPHHQRVIVRNNQVINSRNAGIAFRTVSNGVIEGNLVSGFGKTGGYGGDGIFVEGGYNLSAGVEIINNTVTQTYETGKANGIYVTGMDDVVINENLIENSRGKGLFVQASYIGEKTKDFPNGVRQFHNVKINQNDVSDNLEQGIHIQGYNAYNVVIRENVVAHNGKQGIQVANLKHSESLEIVDNELMNNALQGIEIFKQNDFRIIGNLIKDHRASAEEATEYGAVYVVDAQNGDISFNTIASHGGLPFKTDGIVIDSESVNDIQVSNNTTLSDPKNEGKKTVPK